MFASIFKSIGVALMSVIMAIFSAFAPPQDKPDTGSGNSGQIQQEVKISLDAAIDIAVADAGIARADAKFTEAKLDSDDLVAHYDIEFIAGANEYDYEIAVADGSILKKEVEPADPSKPGETASNQVTAAPSKNAKDWTKAEIIAYFNAGANRVKYQAKSVTRNYTETKNDADKTELPKAIDAIGKSAMKTFMKRDDKAIVLTSKEDIRNVFPVGGKDWVSKLTPADVKGAKVEDKGGEYQITLTFGTEVNPSGEKGYAAAFGVLTADVVNFDYPGLSLSDQRFTYYNGTISAKFDKSTGDMVYAHYDYPVIIELTAHLLGSNTRVKVGMTTINDFTIKY